jgi:hypothetical protein
VCLEAVPDHLLIEHVRRHNLDALDAERSDPRRPTLSVDELVALLEAVSNPKQQHKKGTPND